MARKIVNRMALREAAEAAERMEEEAGDEAEGGEGKAKAKAKAKKTPTKRKSRAKEPVDVRMKICWAVYSQSLKRVALFEYHQRKDAEAKADELSKSGKTPHFVQKEKVVIE